MTPSADAVPHRGPADLHTLDSGEEQEWVLSPPLETQYLRIVCTMNAAAELAASSIHSQFRSADCIGFFSIGFS